ncbi:MAG: hypothetical protein ABSG70_16915 [Terriglobales bacterium]|jgi:hypothetical protein
MIGLIVFNVVMLLLCVAAGSRIMPMNLISIIVEGWHNTIGITSPGSDKMRMVAVIWIASTAVLVDGVLFMLVYFTKMLL